MGSILIPYDGLQPSKSALRYASEVFPDGTITVLHSLEPASVVPDSEQRARDQYKRMYESAHELLVEARRLGDDHSASFSAEFVYGHPMHAILRYTSLYTFDQIVIGRDDRTETDDGLSGDIIEAIVRRAHVPVTVVRSAPDDVSVIPTESILVPFDGSPPSCAALRYAIETFPDATVHVLYVQYPFVNDRDQSGIRSSEHADFEEWYGAVQEWHAQTDRDADSILQIAESIASDNNVELHPAVESGTPSGAILDYVDQIKVDHIIVGSHSGDHGTRILLGSVAQQIVRHSRTAVTVVR